MTFPFIQPFSSRSRRNPCLFYAPGNSLTAYERQQPSSGTGGAKALSLTGSGAVRYHPAQGARVNYFPNPRCASAATGWGNLGTTTGGRFSGDAFLAGGTGYESVVSVPNDGCYGPSAKVLNPGTYTFSFDVYQVSGTPSASVYLDGYEQSLVASLGANVTFVSSKSVTGGVTRISGVYTTARTGVHQFAPYFRFSQAGTYRVSNLVVEPGSITIPTYFDGSTSSVSAWLDPITGYLGTAHASPSVSQAVFWPWEATTNMLVNPRAANASSGAGNIANGVTRTIDTAYALVGANSFKAVTNNAASGEYLALSTGASSLGLTGAANPYKGSVYLRGAGTVNVYVQINYSDATVVQGTKTLYTLTDSWVRVEPAAVTLNAAKTVDYMFVIAETDVQQAITFYMTCGQLEQKAYATTYCDGSLGTGHAWTGTAHASSSTRTAMLVSCDETKRISPYAGAAFCAVQPGSSTGDKEAIRVGDGTAALDQFRLITNSGSGTLTHAWTSNGAGATSVTRTSVVVAGSWLSAYGDWIGTLTRLSANGGPMGTAARVAVSGSLVSASDLRIGSYSAGPQNVINGSIGPVLIYDSPLTAAEIAKLVALGPAANFMSILRVS